MEADLTGTVELPVNVPRTIQDPFPALNNA